MEVPTRTCLACRQPANKPALIRLAASDGRVQVDSSAVLQARGAYVCATQDCVEAALRREGTAIARALRSGRDAVDVPGLRHRLDQEISARSGGTTGDAARQQFGESRDDKVTATLSRGVCT